jgi:hypothetical protein
LHSQYVLPAASAPLIAGLFPSARYLPDFLMFRKVPRPEPVSAAGMSTAGSLKKSCVSSAGDGHEI